ncbi:MAG: hypothetical protein HY706_07785 [Candidatus Hydrogenedentes bacterium]|nr:hypothetical protein [Candidatus Hydrogenedentota bacterium]
MPDEMFFTLEGRSLRRGKRAERRTQTCRPCVLWPQDAPDIKLQGVVMDMNAYGLCVRALDAVPAGTEISIQLMRDEGFSEPMAPPVNGRVVRTTPQPNGFVDHGIRLVQKEIERTESRPVEIRTRRPLPSRRTRMHTLDITVGDRGSRRGGR